MFVDSKGAQNIKNSRNNNPIYFKKCLSKNLGQKNKKVPFIEFKFGLRIE